MNKQVNEQMNKQVNEQMNKQVNEQMNVGIVMGNKPSQFFHPGMVLDKHHFIG